ncbi:MAG: tetratricopeptide repeat protein, partial [Bacteroidales bacterium]|nr:tetratricopeptide repeat protein [Bacteroidales bacterium]
VGVGPGNWVLHIYPYYGKYLPSVFRQWRQPHNDYLATASEKGIPGLIIYLLIFILILVRAFKVLKQSEDSKSWWTVFWMLNGLIGFLVISFFSFPAQRINQVIFVCLIVAVILSKHEKSIPDPKKINQSFVKWIFPVPLVFLIFSIWFGVISIRSEYYVSKAQMAKEQQNWREVEKNIEKGYHPLAPIEPKFSMPPIMYKGMVAFHKDKDYKKALGYFKEAYSKHPSNVPVINNIGSTYGEMGQYDSSLVWFQKSLDIFPHYEHALLNLAKVNYSTGNYEQAYKLVLSCDPESENRNVQALKGRIEDLLDPIPKD